jgi:hypothetical protein
MTINRGWIEIFKQTSPNSFTTVLPPGHDVSTVFIDGQLKLQRPAVITTWQWWLDAQFMFNIKKYLAMGVQTVVLAFDDHQHSPAAKAPTQQKRKSRVIAVDWPDRKPLPPTIPAEYERLLYNRTFKTRVIEFVIQSVTKTLQPLLKDEQRIIIDYRGDPIVLSAGGVKGNMPMCVPLGESDVKFVRYLDLGNMVIDAVDSDYVIIAMNQVERMQNTERTCVPDLYVRRLLVDLDSAAKKKKRKLDVNEQPPKPGRQYEHVHINSLTCAFQNKLGDLDKRLQGKVVGNNRLENDVSLLPNTIKVLSALVALCGCDFTTGIPWFGPKTLWKNIDVVWWGMRRAMLGDRRSANHALCPRDIAEYVVSPMWRNILYKKHVSCEQTLFRVKDRFTFNETYNELITSVSLSERIRESLMDETKLACLVKNCNWVAIYWRYPEICPSAVDDRFGFVRNNNGLVRFDKEAKLDDAYF